MFKSINWNIHNVRLAYQLAELGNADLWHSVCGAATGSYNSATVPDDTFTKAAALWLLNRFVLDCKFDYYDSSLSYFIDGNGPISPRSERESFLEDFVALRSDPDLDEAYEAMDREREVHEFQA